MKGVSGRERAMGNWRLAVWREPMNVLTAIEVDFEVASSWAISVIIAIIINARMQTPCCFCRLLWLPLVVAVFFLFFVVDCYRPITVSAINFPFCSSTTFITNATLVVLKQLSLSRSVSASVSVCVSACSLVKGMSRAGKSVG